MRTYRQPFPMMLRALQQDALEAPEVPVATWHAQSVAGNPMLISKELQHVNLEMMIPSDVFDLQDYVKPNLPWAEDHFRERVCGEPLNPSPSEAWWPFAVAGNKAHKEGEVFSHTYPERMWPKRAAQSTSWDAHGECNEDHNHGLRYKLGDLDDVVKLLIRDPYTRQAYLPIWFPEDTGAVEGQRVPCTLGYHFMYRNGQLHVMYPMRSCDLIRHFVDDVYMAARLVQWICSVFNQDAPLGSPMFQPGRLHMNIASLHIFRGDVDKLRSDLAS